MDAIGPMPYSAVNTMVDGGFPTRALNYWKSNFPRLTDQAIDGIIAQFESCPSPMSALLLEHFHGAATRVAPTATAFPHRSVGYNFLIVSEWMDPAGRRQRPWRRTPTRPCRPHFASGRYANYLNADEGADRRGGSGVWPERDRLREVKRRYDPDNVFHLNQNIAP